MQNIKLGKDLEINNIILIESGWWIIKRAPFKPFSSSAGHMEFGHYSTIDLEREYGKVVNLGYPQIKDNYWIFENQPFIVKV